MSRESPRSPRGRFAPSPSGEMHLGNAASALLAWLSVRSRGGSLVLRIEDLDAARSKPEWTEKILEDLQWLGLDWDEGPFFQSDRGEAYLRAFEKLRSENRLYPCFCTRKEIAAAARAPQEPGDERIYAGTCRGLDPEEAGRGIENGERYAWRFRVDPGAPRPRFSDLVHGDWRGGDWPCGDFVVRRSDGVTAYQLAVVVDDAEMGIDEVVRGDDLLPSTLRQLALFDAFGLDAPTFGHVPLWVDLEGVRLSKRQEGITLRELRERGLRAEQVLGRLAELAGLRDDPSPRKAADLVPIFDWSRVRRAPAGIPVDTRGW